ncbi:MAG: hypothetical protein ACYTGR_11330 [Planctomycetota bacterium]
MKEVVMDVHDRNDATSADEATEEQLTLLRELGVPEADLVDMPFDVAEEMIAELEATREAAGQFDRRAAHGRRPGV